MRGGRLRHDGVAVRPHAARRAAVYGAHRRALLHDDDAHGVAAAADLVQLGGARRALRPEETADASGLALGPTHELPLLHCRLALCSSALSHAWALSLEPRLSTQALAKALTMDWPISMSWYTSLGERTTHSLRPSTKTPRRRSSRMIRLVRSGCGATIPTRSGTGKDKTPAGNHQVGLRRGVSDTSASQRLQVTTSLALLAAALPLVPRMRCARRGCGIASKRPGPVRNPSPHPSPDPCVVRTLSRSLMTSL